MKIKRNKNKYVDYLWVSLIVQLVWIGITFILQNTVHDNFRFMLIPLLPGVILNYFLNKKADKEQERLKNESSDILPG